MTVGFWESFHGSSYGGRQATVEEERRHYDNYKRCCNEKTFPKSNPWWKAATAVKQKQPAKNNVHDFVSDLKSCSRKRDLQEGRRIHSNAVKTGNDSNIFVAAALINMYSKCGTMVDARRVFDCIEEPDVVSWTALILGYAENGEGQAALDLFFRMEVPPNSVTFVAALKACTSLAAGGDESGKGECLKHGRIIHLKIGLHMNRFMQSTLLNMYAKCGSMVYAQRVFDNIVKPDVVSWTALILGYADNGEGEAALELFSRMKTRSGCAPNSVTYVAAIKACTTLAAGGDTGKRECLKQGRVIHSEIGHHMNNFVQSTLINMYAKCGSMVDARKMFNSTETFDVVSWNALILGYEENGEGLVALDLFSKMKSTRGCAPNSVTYVAAIKACTSLALGRHEAGKRECLVTGRMIHSEIRRSHMDNFVESTLINMYAKTGSMVDAQRMFDGLHKPNVVSWNALILGYLDNGEGQAALDLFFRMKSVGKCDPNSVTYIAAFKACACIGALVIGRKLHSEIPDFDVQVVTSLVDFYAKCGSMIEACNVFESHSRVRNVATWTALLAGYGRFGDTGYVFNLFEAMQDQGFWPDAVTFVCMLLCCSHAGLVEKARSYLDAMPIQYGVVPSVIHYSCMVDVLGRANQLDEAVVLLQKMPCNPNAVTWMALLSACCKWKNVEIGRMAFHSMERLNEKSAAACVLMAQIYGSRSMWVEQERVLETKMQFGAPKLSGQAYVMDGVGEMVEFVVGEDEDDPSEVKDKLNQLIQGMKEHGHVAESDNIYSHTAIAADDEKEVALCSHSERRAVVYGILKTPPGEPVRAFKNTRMCEICHYLTKNFSKVCGRCIIVRDDSRFHVMENGNCSCGEFW